MGPARKPFLPGTFCFPSWMRICLMGISKMSKCILAFQQWNEKYIFVSLSNESLQSILGLFLYQRSYISSFVIDSWKIIYYLWRKFPNRSRSGLRNRNWMCDTASSTNHSSGWRVTGVHSSCVSVGSFEKQDNGASGCRISCSVSSKYRGGCNYSLFKVIAGRLDEPNMFIQITWRQSNWASRGVQTKNARRLMAWKDYGILNRKVLHFIRILDKSLVTYRYVEKPGWSDGVCSGKDTSWYQLHRNTIVGQMLSAK